MPTHLEMVFNFTADDLGANKQGKLSADQQVERDVELSKLRQFVKMFTLLQIAVPIMIIVRVGIAWLVYDKLTGGSWGYALIGLVLFSIIHLPLRQPRKHLKYLQGRALLETHVVRKKQFSPEHNKANCKKFEFRTEETKVTLSLRQFDALQPMVDYRFYVWASGNAKSSNLLSVEQLDGIASECTALEFTFKFSAADLQANKGGAFTLHQVYEHYNEHTVHRDTHYAFAIISSFLCFVVLIAVINDALCSSFVPLLILSAIGFLYWKTSRLRQKNRQMLDNEGPSVVAGIVRDNFTESEGLEPPIYWFETEEEGQFELSVAQWEALDEDATYTFYYLPVADTGEGHTILSVEIQDE